MSSGPKVLRELGNGWQLRQWEYDGAPLELRRYHLGTETLITGPDKDGDVEIEIDDHGAPSTRAFVPVAALRALLGLPDDP